MLAILISLTDLILRVTRPFPAYVQGIVCEDFFSLINDK